MKNSVRRGLFHPDDIKTVGLSASPGPFSAPLPTLSRRSHLNSSPTPMAPPSFGPASASVHSRSASLAGTNGSFGRAEARRTQSQAEFEKYTEEDDEDYEDVFGKLNGTSQCLFATAGKFLNPCHSDGTHYANFAVEYSPL